MNVLVPALSGFCPGVKAAEKKIFAEKKQMDDKPIFIPGMMINNRSYISHLEAKGVITVETTDDIPQGAAAAVRTHGLNRHIERTLAETCSLLDLTCVNVKKVQNRISKASEDGAFTVISGKRSHPEVLGLESYADNSVVIESEDDLDIFISGKLKPARIFITSQTTCSRKLFELTVSRIRTAFKDADISVFDSICPVTEKKEAEALELQKKADISFVVGDRLSSNANKLFNILKSADERVFFIKDLDDLLGLKLDYRGVENAMIVSSASTPEFIEKEIVEYLESV